MLYQEYLERYHFTGVQNSLTVLMPLLRPWAKTPPVWLCWNQGSYPDPQQCSTSPHLPYFLQNYQIFLAKANRASSAKCSVSFIKLVTNSQWLPNRLPSSSLPGFHCCQHSATSIWTGRQVTPFGGSPAAFPRTGTGKAWRRADGLEAFRREYAPHLCGTLDIPWPEAHGLQSWVNAQTRFVTQLTV